MSSTFNRRFNNFHAIRQAVAYVALAFGLIAIAGCGKPQQTTIPADTTAAQTQKPTSNPLAITVDVRTRTVGLEFLVRVERLAEGPDGEYLPSGEKIRIEIENELGEEFWSSSAGRMFTQATGPVEPIRVGEFADYREYWDGRNNITGGRLTQGRYRVIVTIPAKPTPYIIREDFTWSGN